MKVKIKPSDADAPESEVVPADGEEIPVEAGDTVQFDGEGPVAGVPVGPDLVLIFDDGSSVVLSSFFDFGEGEPPVLDLGGGGRLMADYSFEPGEGPIGFFFSQISEFNLEGYEPFPLTEFGGLGLSEIATRRLSALDEALEMISDGLTGEVQSLSEAFSQTTIGTILGPGPLVCVDGVFHTGQGSGNKTLTVCNDDFRVTARASNSIKSIDGDDRVRVEFLTGDNQDVQDNFIETGLGNDIVSLISGGGDGTSSNDSDTERNTVLTDGEFGVGDDYARLWAIGIEGDVGRNVVDGGEGNNVLSVEASKDVEFNTVSAGGGDDRFIGYAGRDFVVSGSLPTFNAVALDLPGGDAGIGFEPFSSGMLFDVVTNPAGDPGLDNVSWVGRGGDDSGLSVLSDDAVLAYDREVAGVRDGQITTLDEIDFTDDFAGATTSFEGLQAFDEVANGGNANGMLDPGDAGFENFFVWQDTNGDGRGVGSELMSLEDLGLESINLTGDGADPETELGGQVLINDGSSATINGDSFTVEDVTFVAARGGESSQRGDLQNNTFDAGGGNDAISLKGRTRMSRVI